MAVTGKTLWIGLLWHSANSGNLGVGALTVANMALAKAAAQAAGRVPRFRVISTRDFGTRYVAGPDIDSIELDTRSLLSPRGYWASIKSIDVILDIGAGDSFADIYGYKRFGFLLLTKAMAALRGKPLLMSPQTIGPFTRQPHRFLAQRAMAHAETIFARDPVSFRLAREMSPNARVIEAVDVAFMLPHTPHPGFGNDKLDVGVNVSGMLFHHGNHSSSNYFGMTADHPTLMRRLLSALTDRQDIRLHLVTHCTASNTIGDDDGRVADLLVQEFPQAIRVPDFASPSDAKSYISGLDFLYAGRMHACIAAFSSGVPVVPIAYSPKFAGLFEGVLGYHHVVPAKGFDADQSLTFMLDRLDRRAELKTDIDRGNLVVADRLALYVDELQRLFGKIA